MQKSFQDLLQKREGDRSVWEYPFAVAGVNITFMLIQMLDLEAGYFLKQQKLIVLFISTTHQCLVKISVASVAISFPWYSIFDFNHCLLDPSEEGKHMDVL